jgi:hypothetical protein
MMIKSCPRSKFLSKSRSIKHRTNGAGKTTAVSQFSDTLKPTLGDCTFWMPRSVRFADRHGCDAAWVRKRQWFRYDGHIRVWTDDSLRNDGGRSPGNGCLGFGCDRSGGDAGWFDLQRNLPFPRRRDECGGYDEQRGCDIHHCCVSGRNADTDAFRFRAGRVGGSFGVTGSGENPATQISPMI